MALASTTLTSSSSSSSSSSFFFFFMIISAALLHAVTVVVVEAEQQRQRDSSNIISLGSFLTPTTNSSWLSMSGLYAFGFYPEGNGYAVGVFIAGIPETTVVWTANRDDPPVPSTAILALTSEGKLILKKQQNQDVTYIADVSEPASTASMLDSGNFVLYNSNQDTIWQSFDYPTDTILQGQRLSAGQRLVSSASETSHSTGIFTLDMQRDGQLVQYPIDAGGPWSQNAYWASGTNGNGDNCSLHLDGDGHLYLLNATSANIRNITNAEPTTTTKEEKIYMMKIDVDGLFRVYSRRLRQRRIFDPKKDKWSIWWNSTSDKCDPKGLCGINAFCIPNDDKADCRCIPGYSSVIPGSWISGCQRNFAIESCNKTGGGGGGDGDTRSYIMSALENTRWEDDSYSVQQVSSRNECEDECLQDCQCDAALFSGDEEQRCSKQRLPLRFGRRKLGYSSVALIKVAVNESTAAAATTKKMWLICFEPSNERQIH